MLLLLRIVDAFLTLICSESLGNHYAFYSRLAISYQGALTTGVAAGALAGFVALLWPSSLGDSSLYTEEQLQLLDKARTRVRIHVEQQADGTLKGYGYNTQKRTDWEMIPVVQFNKQGSQQVADFGDGVTLT